jgi:hypothetical protein
MAGAAAAGVQDRPMHTAEGLPYAAYDDGAGPTRAFASMTVGKGDKVVHRSGAARFGRIAAGFLIIMMLMGGLAAAFSLSAPANWDVNAEQGSSAAHQLTLFPQDTPRPQPAPRAVMEVLPPVSLDRLPATTAHTNPLPTVGTVLVLDDLDANDGNTLGHDICARLRSAQYAVIGDRSEDIDTSESDIELLAGARAAVGLSDPGDDEAVARLTTFLREQNDSLDAILWIGHAGENQPPRSRAITRDEAVALELTTLLNG